MRVLIVSDYGTRTGGAEVLLLALRDGLRRRGHEVRLLASAARPAGMASLADASCLGTLSRARTLLQTANPWAVAALRRTLAQFRPDVVHVGVYLTQLSPLILSVLGEVPSLYHAHWYRAVCPTGFKWLPQGRECRVPAGAACLRHGCVNTFDWPLRMLQLRMNRSLARRFSAIVATSEAVAAALRDEGLGPIQVLRPGVPRVSGSTELATRPTVVFAGRLERGKGAAVLLEAFVRVVRERPEARLVIAGDGSEATGLDRSIRALGLEARVARLGFVPHEQLTGRLAGAWVQAVPSLCPEPFGLVAAEAMMRGTAVIASDTGGLREVVKHGETGLLVAPGDVGALADALARLLGDAALAERLGTRGRALAEASFAEDAFVEAFLLVYRRLSDRRPQAGG
jgi:glycosyltransferase involved in cell wall biosynthesis